MAEFSVWLVVHMFVEMSWAGGWMVVGQNVSSKIRKICHVGCVLLPVFFRWCFFLEFVVFFLQNNFPLGSY